MTNDLVRVFAVDDHAGVLRAVAKVVAATDGFSLVGTATSGAEALLVLDDDPQPDLLLLDVQMPGISGIETAQRYLEEHRDAVVILMSAAELEALPAHTLSRGVAGFLPKSTLSPDALHDAWKLATAEPV